MKMTKTLFKNLFGKNYMITESDGASIKFGDDDSNFAFYLYNGSGDGENRIAVISEEELQLERTDMTALDFGLIGVLEGKFGVYQYDCGNEILKTLQGKFNVYQHKYDNYTVLEKSKF